MTTTPLLPPTWNAADATTAGPFARLLFSAAELAYKPKSEGLTGFRDLGLDAEFIEHKSTQAYALNAGGDAILAFRGTAGFEDILTDLNFIRRRTPGGRIHSGFWEGYDHIHSVVAHFGAKAAERGGKVWFTGHSLGGALAVVAAYRIGSEKQLPIGGVVTFGQPMVGRPDFAQTVHALLHDRYLCFVNGSDMIPNLVRPYVHFGQLVLYRNGSFLRWNVLPGDENTKPREVFGQAGPSPQLTPLDDAQLDEMIKNLEAEQGPTSDSGDAKMLGMLPWTADHSLAAYSQLVDAFVAVGSS